MTTVYLAPGPFGAGGQFFGLGGLPLNLGTITTYAAGSTTPLATYTTSAGAVQNANPIVLGTDGRPPNEIWITGDSYRFDLKDSLGNLIKTYDDLSTFTTAANLSFIQSGIGAVARTQQDKSRDQKHASDFTSPSVAIADRITATGGKLELAQNTSSTITSTISLTSPIGIDGAGQKTQFLGSGITILQIAETGNTYPGARLEDFIVYDSTGNASTIAILVENTVPASGINNFSLRRMGLRGTGTLGVGVKTTFALKGVIDDCVIESFSKGIQLTASGASKSNANWIHGSKIRVNTIGISAESQDDLYIAGCTIEGNSTGLLQAEGKSVVLASHFENNLGSKKQVEITTGSYVSVGNFYGGGDVTFKDIYIVGGAFRHLSAGDTLNSGIVHNGTGSLLCIQPMFDPTITGTGPVTVFTANTLAGTNQTGSNFVISGFNVLDVRQAIYDLSGANTRLGMASGKKVAFLNNGGSVKAAINENGVMDSLATTNGPCGTFTLAAAATTVINNTVVTAASLIRLQATNAAAATLMGSAKSLYISAISAGASFTVATASGVAAGGTETFSYFFVN